MNRMIIKYLSTLVLLCISSQSLPQDDTWTFKGTLNLSSASYKLSEIVNGQTEINLFLDALYLEQYGAAVGYIRQDQGISNSDDIVNDIMYLNGWYRWYPEMVPGKVTLALNYYNGSETTHGSRGGSSGPGTGPGPGPRAAKPSPVTTTVFTDSLSIVNPVISYMNYSNSLYLDIGLARSTYNTSNTTTGDLKVNQWSPAIGYGINDLYDWFQLRMFYIDLSNDLRTPGTDNTLAASVSWTHWLQQPGALTPQKITAKILLGERLYAVDHDIRKLYNLTDMQTGSVMFGADWQKKESINLYVYAGYEQFEDVAGDNNYESLFIYTGITNQW